MRMREIAYDPQSINEMSYTIDDPDDNHEAIYRRVRDAVDAMEGPARDVVECLMWGRMTKIECANLLGMARSTVNKLWTEATKELDEALSYLYD
jgi:DNA-directed RNA polymerase specialized sigma24 family protein